jgi:pimeloyl-ACP methyl ester carboxylesterase
MAYMDVKPKHPNGKAIILLHGKNFNGAYWGETASVLSDKGYRVIIPDQLGFGKSDKPQVFQYSFYQLAKNTKALLDTLGIKTVIVLGHSMGGMLASRFALSYPEVTEKLILTDPIGLEDYQSMIPYQGVDARYQVELSQTYNKIREYELTSYYHGEWKPQYDEWLNVFAGWTESKDFKKIAWNAALTYDMIMTQPVCYELSNITEPTLLIIGQSDRTAVGKDDAPPQVKETMGNYPALGKATHEKIKNSKLVELPGIGHVPQVEDFEAFIKPVLEFIK